MNTPNSKHLRQYSRFLYQFINRFDFGWDNQSTTSTEDGVKTTGERRRVEKWKLKRARETKTNRYCPKITEKHLLSHLSGQSTYYYTGCHKTHKLLLCCDIDAKDGELDTLDVAQFLNFWFLNNSGFIEPSTHGSGIHLYFILSYPEFTSSSTLKTLINELKQVMDSMITYEGFESHLDLIGGLPSDWVNDVMAQIIKLPRPTNSNELKALLNMPVITITTMAANIKTAIIEHPAFIKGESTQFTPISLSSSSCIMIVAPGTQIIKKKREEVEEVKHRNALYRALWTVRTLGQVLGRMPTLEESLGDYERLQLGTGSITPQRIKRFEQVISFTAKTFDPAKRISFTRILPRLIQDIRQALQNKPTSLTYQKTKDRTSHISIESIAVAYYCAINKNQDDSLPIVGIVSMNKLLKESGLIKTAITNQMASKIRNILVDIGLLEIIDANYSFGWKHVAKKYKVNGIDAL